ncbi:hypothetical protein [Sedimentitalea todarodis]|uniref:Uncharacterized protein n=1 Tax=Sedimentitalea todarodis TaxID=1631240 RepID=A0ABU3VEX2_9RHOB|nr:hypothetical protein [Sedimentitalea todarodis]MDU9004731.1 hypothetical protein [Sedimentitalea todarodis]
MSSIKGPVLILALYAASRAVAQEVCIEPFRPNMEYLADGGVGPEEMRDAYRVYFSEVETYLNCLNVSSARIREEATAAVQEYNRVLDQYPAPKGQVVESEPAPRIEMSETGTLFLDYQADWLR